MLGWHGACLVSTDGGVAGGSGGRSGASCWIWSAGRLLTQAEKEAEKHREQAAQASAQSVKS